MTNKKVGDTLTRCYHEFLMTKAKLTSIDEILIMDKQDMIYFLGVLFHIKKDKAKNVLQDLIDYGLIVQVNRGKGGIKYRILG